MSKSPRPLWRWWLFCAALWLDVRFGWKWSRDLWAWCNGEPSWWAVAEDDPIIDRGEAPF